MTGEEHCKRRLYEAALEADLILVEGVMGMFDGNPSGADMAEFFGIPVAIVISARSMAQTFGALATGLATFRPSLSVAGVIANHLGGDRHKDLVVNSIPDDVSLLGCIPSSPKMALPERHLGLVHPHEVDDMDQRLDQLARLMDDSGLTRLPEPVEFSAGEHFPAPALLKGVRIAIAKDDAFTFVYADNVNLLQNMGASIHWFSPLTDESIPECDAIWLPGGYPELHHQQLANNKAMQQALQAFSQSGKRILAECGGMLYLMQSLTDVEGNRSPMMGLLAGDGIMRDRGGCQGMQYALMPEGELRAHAHHRTRCENTAEPIGYGRRTRHPAPGEPIYRKGGITASYLHLYFPSNPKAIAQLLTPIEQNLE